MLHGAPREWLHAPYGTPATDDKLDMLELRMPAILREGVNAKQELIERNIRLAVHVARKFHSQTVPLEDLVQEGVIGLDRAADKFDPRKGYKFSTYATWWIRHMIQRGIHRDRATIRVPGHIVERRRKIDQYLTANPDATNEEIAAKLKLTVDQVDDALSGARVVVSLDQPLAEDSQSDRYGVMADEHAEDPAIILTESLSDKHAPADFRAAWRKLSNLEQRVLELRWGFHGDVMSRDQVAAQLGMGPHIIQRTQKRAMAKLKQEMENPTTD